MEDIPLHVKYKIGLPIVGKVLSPYVFTGPCFAVRASKAEIVEGAKAKSADVHAAAVVFMQVLIFRDGPHTGIAENATEKAATTNY